MRGKRLGATTLRRSAGSPRAGSAFACSCVGRAQGTVVSMFSVSTRAGRGLALAALTVACVVIGPAPQLLDAAERIFAVAIAEEETFRRTRGRDRVPGGPGRAKLPRHRHPHPTRP